MKTRLVWIDIAKSIAILSVVLGHTFLFGNPVLTFVMSYHVPLFFALSGYTFNPDKFNVLKLAKRILLPYLMVCLFLLILNVMNNGFSQLITFLLSVIWGSGGDVLTLNIPGIGLCWFLLALFFGKTAFYFFEKLLGYFRLNEYSKFLIYIMLAISSWKIGSLFPFPFALNQSFVSLPFLYLGSILSRIDFRSNKSNRLVFAGCCLVWFLGLKNNVFFSIGNMFNNGSLVFGLLMCLSSCYVLIRLLSSFESVFKKSNWAKFISRLGSDSLLILCLHQIEITGIAWSAIEFVSFGDYSFLIVGLCHVLFVISIYLIVIVSQPTLLRSFF